MNMKFCVLILSVILLQSTEASVFTSDGHQDGLHNPVLNHRRSYRDWQNELKSMTGTFPEPSRLLLALISGRVYVPVVRAMLSRYVSQHSDFENLLRPALQRREELVQSLLMFHEIAEMAGNAILGRLEEEADDRIYTFLQDASCNCIWYYIDEHDHEVKGFFKDLILAVCKEAGKKCVFQYAPYNMCVNIGPSSDFEAAGIGILSGDFDGCDVSKTSQIANAMLLSDTWMKHGGESRFFVPIGNPQNFNPNDINGKNIGFLKGWYSNQRCLIDSKVKGAESLKWNQVHFFDFARELPDRFLENKIDAAFLQLNLVKEDELDKAGMLGGTPPGLEPIGDVIRCTDGEKLAVRKDSRVLEWFNAALRRMKMSGKYAKLCREAQIEHGGKGWFECTP
ncbi:uncharacterized protein [Ptychodera flava]|uniref:uncharacterized protein n=1 Tax=Ptychodera flava TaxID=63121 RepID=UPI00396A29CC